MPSTKYPIPKYLVQALTEAINNLEGAKVRLSTVSELATRGALDGVEPVEGASLRILHEEGVVEVVLPEPPPSAKKPDAPAG